jgi:hypothetical protein
MPGLVRALIRVDLPTLGRPTMQLLRLMEVFLGFSVESVILKGLRGLI